MNKNPFEYELGQKMYHLHRGELIKGYISMRQCTDQLHPTRTREATASKTRNISYSFQESAAAGVYSERRSFGAVPTHELYKTKEEAAMQLLRNAGVDVGLVSIGEER